GRCDKKLVAAADLPIDLHLDGEPVAPPRQRPHLPLAARNFEQEVSRRSILLVKADPDPAARGVHEDDPAAQKHWLRETGPPDIDDHRLAGHQRHAGRVKKRATRLPRSVSIEKIGRISELRCEYTHPHALSRSD